MAGLLALVVASLGVPDRARAQAGQDGIEADLPGLSAPNAELFVRPLTRGLAFAVGSGLFDGADPLDGLDFEVGARVAGAIPPPRTETFEAVVPGTVVWESPFGGTFEDPYRSTSGSLETPTVAGEGPGIVLEPDGEFRDAILASGRDPSELAIVLPAGPDVPLIPYPVFHASLGVGLGTEVSIRFVPELEVDREIGGVQGIGLAVRHAVTHWFSSPIDLSVLAARQHVEVGGYLDASSTQYGLLASRRLGPLSIFASGFVTSGEVDVVYSTDNPADDNPGLPPDGTSVRLSEELESDAAFGVGARLQFLILNVSGQYTFEDYPVWTLKVGFGTP